MNRILMSMAAAGLTLALGMSVPAGPQDMLGRLAGKLDFRSQRVSSYDRSGGNQDSLSIDPGQTAVLAEIKGPAALHHIWMTIAAEPFYGRKIVLRIYWDGEEAPSVEAPVGDFFGVGHGLNRNLGSLPIACSSEGRARNSYWLMPFRWSCRVTATNEGDRPIDAFYYYIDYRELDDIEPEAPYFHAQYRQEFPCERAENYLILEASGAGHYVGCNLSVLQRAMGWWGEGDDMIYIDGETSPSLNGTGSEDYFSDAWGMREGQNLFYGCPLQEPDFQAGSKASVYRFHIPDPIPFQKSIRVTIEHGHANDRADDYSSVAYWYQTEPHNPFPPLPPVAKRIPLAFEPGGNFVYPIWEAVPGEEASVFLDKVSGLRFRAPRAASSLTSYYDRNGTRCPALITEQADQGTRAEISVPVEVEESYDIEVLFLKGPAMGDIRVFLPLKDGEAGGVTPAPTWDFTGYAGAKEIGGLSLKNVLLKAGMNTIILEAVGRDAQSAGMDMAFLGMSLTPSSRRFVAEWNLAGPFDAPDMDSLLTVCPPEKETDLAKKYAGKNNVEAGWRIVRADDSGYVRLSQILRPNEQAVAYGLAYVHSPDERDAYILLGSDDGVRLWLNDSLVFSNPAYRGAYPDQDTVSVKLRKGWNKVLIKVLQGGGGWGYYLRVADPRSNLRWALTPQRAGR